MAAYVAAAAAVDVSTPVETTCVVYEGCVERSHSETTTSSNEPDNQAAPVSSEKQSFGGNRQLSPASKIIRSHPFPSGMVNKAMKSRSVNVRGCPTAPTGQFVFARSGEYRQEVNCNRKNNMEEGHLTNYNGLMTEAKHPYFHAKHHDAGPPSQSKSPTFPGNCLPAVATRSTNCIALNKLGESEPYESLTNAFSTLMSSGDFALEYLCQSSNKLNGQAIGGLGHDAAILASFCGLQNEKSFEDRETLSTNVGGPSASEFLVNSASSAGISSLDCLEEQMISSDGSRNARPLQSHSSSARPLLDDRDVEWSSFLIRTLGSTATATATEEEKNDYGFALHEQPDRTTLPDLQSGGAINDEDKAVLEALLHVVQGEEAGRLLEKNLLHSDKMAELKQCLKAPGAGKTEDQRDGYPNTERLPVHNLEAELTIAEIERQLTNTKALRHEQQNCSLGFQTGSSGMLMNSNSSRMDSAAAAASDPTWTYPTGLTFPDSFQEPLHRTWSTGMEHSSPSDLSTALLLLKQQGIQVSPTDVLGLQSSPSFTDRTFHNHHKSEPFLPTVDTIPRGHSRPAEQDQQRMFQWSRGGGPNNVQSKPYFNHNISLPANLMEYPLLNTAMNSGGGPFFDTHPFHQPQHYVTDDLSAYSPNASRDTAALKTALALTPTNRTAGTQGGHLSSPNVTRNIHQVLLYGAGDNNSNGTPKGGAEQSSNRSTAAETNWPSPGEPKFANAASLDVSLTALPSTAYGIRNARYSDMSPDVNLRPMTPMRTVDGPVAGGSVHKLPVGPVKPYKNEHMREWTTLKQQPQQHNSSTSEFLERYNVTKVPFENTSGFGDGNPRLKIRLKRHGKGQSDGPTYWGMWEDERARMVYVSWLPRTARATDRNVKKRCELVLKNFIQQVLDFSGLEKVLLFPPTSAHCKLLWANVKRCIFLQRSRGTNVFEYLRRV